MEQILNPILIKADVARGFVLSKTLQIGFLRRLFYDRAGRLLWLFGAACAVYLPLSLFFPVWVAVLGPIMYGLPHIVSSLRYTRRNSPPSLKSFFITIWIGIAFYRIATDLGGVETGSALILDVEFTSWILSFSALWFFTDRTLRTLLKGAFLLALVLIAAWEAPLATAGILLLVHNYVAFIYWIYSTKNRREFIVAVITTLAFCALSAAILMGGFDGLLKVMSPQGYLAIFDIDYSDLGKILVPWSKDPNDWYRYFVLYVFGQSLHYFVWLKAIPDQHLKSQAPVSFRESFRLLKADFGSQLLWALAIACIGSVGIWFFYQMPEARLIYFAIASYHGFLEFAGLPFQKLRWRLT